jgi:hypothetical protein
LPDTLSETESTASKWIVPTEERKNEF